MMICQFIILGKIFWMYILFYFGFLIKPYFQSKIYS